MPIERTIRYTSKKVTILWKPHLCIHSGICARGLPEVFKPREKPWIEADATDAQRVIDQVAKCPSGALSIASVEEPSGAGSSASDPA